MHSCIVQTFLIEITSTMLGHAWMATPLSLAKAGKTAPLHIHVWLAHPARRRGWDTEWWRAKAGVCVSVGGRGGSFVQNCIHIDTLLNMQTCLERGILAGSPKEQMEALNGWVSVSTSFRGIYHSTPYTCLDREWSVAAFCVISIDCPEILLAHLPLLQLEFDVTQEKS